MSMNQQTFTLAERQLPRFATVRETARMGFIGEYALRRLIREGRCPGFHTGRTYRINVPVLIDQLNRAGGRVDGQQTEDGTDE